MIKSNDMSEIINGNWEKAVEQIIIIRMFKFNKCENVI